METNNYFKFFDFLFTGRGGIVIVTSARFPCYRISHTVAMDLQNETCVHHIALPAILAPLILIVWQQQQRLSGISDGLFNDHGPHLFIAWLPTQHDAEIAGTILTLNHIYLSVINRLFNA